MKLKTALILSVLSLLYVYLGFYNGYPLVTSDTGAYINTGYELYMPADRPIFYSLFLRLFSVEYSLWIPIIVQGALLTFLTYRLSSVLLTKQYFSDTMLAIIAITVVSFTSVSWYSSQLMPDIFTPILILGVVLYFIDSMKFGTYIYALLVFSSVLMHNSNLIILFLFSGLIILHSYFKERAQLRKALQIGAVSILALLFTSFLHFFNDKGFTLSQSSHVFLIAKMSENGVLKTYLDDKCYDGNFQLCDYKDNLPTVAWDFVWSQNSPLSKAGGWEAVKPEYKMIIKDLILSPKYYPIFAYKSIEHTLRQITQIQVGDGLNAYREGTNPFWKVQEYYNHELPEYLSSKQNKSVLSWDSYNIIYSLFLVISSLFVLLLFRIHPPSSNMKYTYFLIISFFIINAFVTANFANVLARLSSRVVWLIPMINVIYICKILAKKYPDPKLDT